nr:biotin-dependent carboxyltransferase family protein [Nocardioides perillae]
MAALGVGRSGAADRAALRLANRLVGNPEGHAGLEVTLGGLTLVATAAVTVAVAGAPCSVTVDGRAEPAYSCVRVPAGATVRLGTPSTGLRGYLAVRGGVDVAPVLGSRATDTLAGVGPPPVEAGTRLPVGRPRGPLPDVDLAPVSPPTGGDVRLRVLPGPRLDWCDPGAWAVLLATPWEVSADSDRVGLRLGGAELRRVRDGELPSEGTVPGALQLPPTGRPTLLLADHPVTGGYPVVGVVRSADVDRAAQARPGQRLRFVAG